MKICAIGDPHGSIEKIKKIDFSGVDLIILTGDIGAATLARKRFFDNIERQKNDLEPLPDSITFDLRCYNETLTSTLKILRYLTKKAPVMTIYGNVEYDDAYSRLLAKETGKKVNLFTSSIKSLGVRVVHNAIAKYQSVRIGGLRYFIDTSWVQEFKPSGYATSLKRAKRQTDKVKKILKWFGKVDILVCHQPPYGILDKVGGAAPKHWHGKHAGSKAILQYIKAKKPKYVFCGHIHEGAGKKKIGPTTVYNLGVADHIMVTFND